MEKPSENVGIPWLLGELKDLVKRQVVSPETSGDLESYYKPKALAEEQADRGRMYLYMTSLLAGLAALLIGGGMILIFNHNWDDFSREIRAAIAILPAAIGLGLAAWVLACDKSRSWREFAGIWLMLSAFSSLGIIAQTYHLGGKFSTFMMVVTLMTLFVPVLLRSLGANILQLICFISWVIAANIHRIWGETPGNYHDIFICIGLPLALIPYYVSTFANKSVWERRFDSIALVISSYFLIPMLLNNFIEKQPRIFFLLLFTAACIQLLIGRWIKLHGDSRVAKPWHVGGWFGIAGISIILSEQITGCVRPGNPFSWWLLPVTGLVLYSIWRLFQKRWFEGLVGLLPILVFCAMLYNNGENHHQSWDSPALFNPGPLFMTLAFTLFSIVGATIGYLKRDGGIFTGSMIVLLLAITVRFFDGEYSALNRGLVFLAAGVVVLIINLLVTRLSKNRAGSLTEESSFPIIQQTTK